jgi:hypothetical protein
VCINVPFVVVKTPGTIGARGRVPGKTPTP